MQRGYLLCFLRNKVVFEIYWLVVSSVFKSCNLLISGLAHRINLFSSLVVVHLRNEQDHCCLASGMWQEMINYWFQHELTVNQKCFIFEINACILEVTNSNLYFIAISVKSRIRMLKNWWSVANLFCFLFFFLFFFCFVFFCFFAW